MTCPSSGDLLEHFVDDLPSDKKLTVKAHLTECTACQDHLSYLSDATGRIAPDPGEMDDPDLATDVLELIRLGQAPVERASRNRWVYRVAPVLAI